MQKTFMSETRHVLMTSEVKSYHSCTSRRYLHTCIDMYICLHVIIWEMFKAITFALLGDTYLHTYFYGCVHMFACDPLWGVPGCHFCTSRRYIFAYILLWICTYVCMWSSLSRAITFALVGDTYLPTCMEMYICLHVIYYEVSKAITFALLSAAYLHTSMDMYICLHMIICEVSETITFAL